MQHWTLLEILSQLHTMELLEQASRPVVPTARKARTSWRRGLARSLIKLGVRLDAETSRALISSTDTAPRLNGSDA